MPNLQDLLKARFAAVRQDLQEAIGELRETDLDWNPHSGMKTIRGQLMEIANKEIETLRWVATGTWPDDYEGAFKDDASLETIQHRLDAIRGETLALIDSLGEDRLRRPVPNPEGWWEALRLRECPLDEILRNITAHEWYHTGQIVTYLQMRDADLDE